MTRLSPSTKAADNSSGLLGKLIRQIKGREQDPLLLAIYEYLLKRGSAKHRLASYTIPFTRPLRPPGRLSPSSLGGCARAAVMAFVGAPGKRRLSSDKELIFDQGDWIHHKWYANFQDMQLVLGEENFKVLAIEQPIVIPELYIAGTLDADVLIKGQATVVDLKSNNSNQHYRTVATGEGKIAHLWQLATYLIGRKRIYGTILYDNKDNQQLNAASLKDPQGIWKEARQWAKSVIAHIDRRSLPPMDPGCQAGSMMANSCQFRHICYSELSRRQIEKKVFRTGETAEEYWLRGLLMAKQGAKRQGGTGTPNNGGRA